jgi:hypothetical protein
MLFRDMEDLPGALLQEVADFVRFLKEKTVRERMEPAHHRWNRLVGALGWHSLLPRMK